MKIETIEVKKLEYHIEQTGEHGYVIRSAKVCYEHDKFKQCVLIKCELRSEDDFIFMSTVCDFIKNNKIGE